MKTFIRKSLNYPTILALALTTILLSCDEKKSEKDAAKEVAVENIDVAQNFDFETREGDYVTDAYQERAEGKEWAVVSVQRLNDKEAQINILSRADKKEPNCTFDQKAEVLDKNTLLTEVEGRKITFTFKDETITVSTVYPADRLYLEHFCSGEGSIAGVYNQLETPLNEGEKKSLN
tara:strand:+ start:550 stop:1080 length:531 start_codon:yes stop_codon:yes gene_type:complete